MGEVAGFVHEKFVFGRRTSVLAGHLAALIPAGGRVLDVGCGDGTIDCLIARLRPDVAIEGIDVLVRASARIPVKAFDGRVIPYPEASFDVVMFVDVLHHAGDPLILLREALRVGRAILVKDHLQEGLLAAPTLRLMDWVGNAHHGVALPYNYWSKAEWSTAFRELGITATKMTVKLGLYPAPASWVFERELHFIAKLERG
ncbi:MAG TPA: class I SAM-dependent methyltransferase [Candidatus Acidoferrales bacterium]|nr:class I SAM-dependent methyltransferase [Candidatus Acidoferrales bacterium]